MQSCDQSPQPKWERLINEAMALVSTPTTSIDELHNAKRLLKREIETQEDGPGNRAHLIARLRAALEFVNGALSTKE
jgi:hypothetical protein